MHFPKEHAMSIFKTSSFCTGIMEARCCIAESCMVIPNRFVISRMGGQEMKFYVCVWMQVMLAGVLLGSATQELDIEVLLEGYNLCNREFETISYDLVSDSQSRRRRLVYTTKYCARGNCKQWIGHRTLNMYNEDGTTRPAIRERVADIYDGTRIVHINRDNPKEPPKASLYGTAGGLLHKISQGWAEGIEQGGPLVGRVFGSDFHSVYDLLKRASNVTLHDTATNILDYDAYLLEANTRYGIVRAWISPDAGNNCLKWEIVKAQSQFYRDGATAGDFQFTHWVAAYDAERVEQIDGRYITTQAKFKYIVTDGDTERSNYTHHYKLTNIDFDPDYEAMGAFKIQLPEGTMATHEEVPGIQFRWTNGKFVPNIDDYLIQNLIGKPLPDFNMIKTDFDLEQAVGKRILVCFWDMQQRPSRNCIVQLGKKVQELKEKEVVVIAVHASNIDEKTLTEWVKKNNIPFPAGMIQGGVEEIRSAWGVKSLPWLILTDSRHMVVDTGFGLSELNGKIEAAY
jgi:hypothetical protein